MEQIDNKEPINANAEYIAFDLNNHKTLVDMHDIKEIKPIQQVMMNGTDKKIMIYAVEFKDNLIWQIPIDDKSIEKFKKFQESIDKKD